MISDLNEKLFCGVQEGSNAQEEHNQTELETLIDNGGVLVSLSLKQIILKLKQVTYNPSVVKATCKEDVNHKLICNPDTHAPFLKTFNKSLRRRREKPKLDAPIFKFALIDPTTSVEKNPKLSQKKLEGSDEGDQIFMENRDDDLDSKSQLEIDDIKIHGEFEMDETI